MKIKKLKIVNVTTIKELRGGDIQMLNIIRQFKKQELFENYVLIRKEAILKKYLDEDDILYFEAPRANNLDFRFVLKIISVVKEISANVIHVHDSTALTFTVLASYFLPKDIKILYTRKSNNPIKDKKLNRWKYNHSGISNIICVTNNVQDVLKNSIVDHSKLVTIYDGISTEKKETLPLQNIYHKSDENEILIGIFAGLTKAKDLFTFIDVAKKVIVDYPNAHFLIFGEGELKKELMDYSKENNTEMNVHFLGYVQNAVQYLPHLQVLLITSIREGLPLSVFEAFLMKVPVVSTNVSSIPEVVVDGETGMLCEVKDSHSLAAKTIKLIENKDLRETITTNAYKLVKENFTLDISYNNYFRYYSSLSEN